MDKKVFRSYSLRQLPPDGTNTLIQFSEYEGEFGPVRISSVCELDGSQYVICRIIEDSGENSAVLYSLRNAELLYFVAHILPLFNPLTFNKDALPFPEEVKKDL